jgi:polar amino acid transport system substrate-binding protein
MKPRVVRAAALTVIALVVASCGGDDTAGDGELPTITEGALTVCTDAPYEPFEMQNEDGSWTGFDMDLMSAIAGNLGLTLEVTIQPFDGIWLAPAAGTCDLVASAMTITEERAEQALFSDGYFDADQSLLVREADAASYPDLESLDGQTIAVQTGTTGEIYARDNTPEGATLKSFDEPAAMFLALESRDVEAILQDLPVNAERAIDQPDAFELTATFPTGEQYGFATSQDQTTLMDAVDAELQALRDDGSYQDIYEAYFGG